MRLIIRPRTICTTSFLFLLLVFRDSVLTGMLKRSGHSEIQERSLDTHMSHGTFKEHLRMFIDYPSHVIDGRVSRQGWEEKGVCHSYRQSFFPRVLTIYHPRVDLCMDDNDRGCQADH